MLGWPIITVLGGGVLLLLATAIGWRRIIFGPFRINPKRMTVRRLGLAVRSHETEVRVDSILGSFAGGFNSAITSRSDIGWAGYCESVSTFNRPFAEEGAAMAYTLRHLFRYRADEFERSLVKPRAAFRYLHYVGLGFWSGMRGHSPQRLGRIVEGLDTLHKYLCYDGYGFKYAFFDYPKNPDVLRCLDGLSGYARCAAYNGVGRAMFFLFMDEPERLVEHIERFGVNAVDAAAGVGLAAVFINPDKLEVAQALAMHMPASWRPHFHLGMCFGLKARSINELDQFECDMGSLSAAARDAVFGSIRECDRIELQVRARTQSDGYRAWREEVSFWLSDKVVYPMAGLKEEMSLPPQRRAVAVKGR